MARDKNYLMQDMPVGRRADILPPEFNPEVVNAFFAGGEKAVAEKFPDIALEPIPRLETAVLNSKTALPALDSPESPSPEEDALDTVSGLETAGFHLETARSVLDPLDLDLPGILDRQAEEPVSAFGDDLSGAGAKPSDAGGGKGGGKSSGSEPGKGGGKTKNEPTTTTEPTNTETTEPTTATEPAADPVSEVNLGSTDPNTYVSGLDTPEGFNIELTFSGAWTEDLKLGLYTAAEYFSDIITGDLPNHNGIDDIQISATLTDIDGAGGFWGWGGTSALRPDSLVPSEGYLRFDSADLGTMQSYGLWEDLILHEMGHALGFGTLWSSMGLIDDYDGDLRFNGANAIEAYNAEFGEIAANDPLSDLGIPVETDGGAGTAGVHWDDATFGNEIMTGQLNWTNVMSDMSIAALEDMGYATTYGDEFIFG